MKLVHVQLWWYELIRYLKLLHYLSDLGTGMARLKSRRRTDVERKGGEKVGASQKEGQLRVGEVFETHDRSQLSDRNRFKTH
jgi:hypothetical protein